MEKMQNAIEELHYDIGALNSEEQVWFPTILRYLQNRGIGDGKHGELLRANPVIMNNFLSKEDLAALLAYTLEHEADFTISQIYKEKDKPEVSRGPGVVKSNLRKSLIMEVDKRYKEMIDGYINKVLPDVLHQLGIEPFPIKRREYQLTASNDGAFFKMHRDKGPRASPVHSRVLTYVYYFNHEPKAFSGGNLQVYDTIKVDDHVMSALNFQTITPLQNQIVFFPSPLMHEVLPVDCPSQQFAASRFTFNGWLHQAPEENN
jgi:SM-20-related protein